MDLHTQHRFTLLRHRQRGVNGEVIAPIFHLLCRRIIGPHSSLSTLSLPGDRPEHPECLFSTEAAFMQIQLDKGQSSTVEFSLADRLYLVPLCTGTSSSLEG